jgi:hypothetical protein
MRQWGFENLTLATSLADFSTLHYGGISNRKTGNRPDKRTF